MVIQIPTKTEPSHNSTFMFANLKMGDQGPAPRPYLLRNFGPVKTYRATIGINSTEPIDLGHVAIGATTESKTIVVSNTQKGMLPEETTDAGKSESATALFGLADVKRDEATADTQSVSDIGGQVGAIFVKANSAGFEFNSPNATDDKSGVKFVGADNTPGLSGAPDPESESFTVRFKGEQKAGTYDATVRIVTQATNLGVLSQGKLGEPPLHLYYVDIPVKVTVP